MTRKKFTVNAQSENSHGQERWGFAGHKCAVGITNKKDSKVNGYR